MEYTIRPFKYGEEQFVARLHKRLYSEEYSWGPSFTDYAEKVAVDFAKKEKSAREELFIAEADGQPVGCIMICETTESDIGQLRIFAVEKEYRKFGIGSALIKAFMEKAKTSGYKKIILWTAAPLVDAIRHYERLGFKTVETVPNNSWRTDGATVYEVKMEKEIEN